MLGAIFKRFLKSSKTKASEFALGDSVIDPSDIMAMGDRHAAIIALQELLKIDPTNRDALNNLGVCYADVGNQVEASRYFELAYALDDKYIPAIVNHANLLVERRFSSRALPFLEQVKLAEANYGVADLVYARLCFVMGNLAMARHFQMRAWLSSFDNLRYANGHLWYAIYDDEDEARVAIEHKFWAETLKPALSPVISNPTNSILGAELTVKTAVSALHRKLRIGYWSPDFVSHSVRYFARPLIENHDRTQFEVFAYHDLGRQDEHTESIRAHVDHFHDVFSMTDDALGALLHSHQLDILVELAGHSSYNRLPLLQQRFAKLQITGLGYPPTTGLSTIDAKVVDVNIVTPNWSSHYAEAPLALPHSFWCFDPMEAATINPVPPIDRNHFVTFACVGNVSKINSRLIRCWTAILEGVPESKLLIRSATFADQASQDASLAVLIAAGIPLERLDLRKPEGGRAFLESYNDIDIVLDTFPFNGGTTTCFATYMGVPVVSIFGQTLASRMGLSILKNLGIGELAVENEAAYIKCAIEIACNPRFLREFREVARQRYQQSSLGNGKIFANDFELACRVMLDKKERGELNYTSSIPVLPANELIRRAYIVMRSGDDEAVQRIIRHCLEHYPHAGAAHLLISQQRAKDQRFEEAVEYLKGLLPSFSEVDQAAAKLNIARYLLLMGRKGLALEQLNALEHVRGADVFDDLQYRMYRACCCDRGKSFLPSEMLLPKSVTISVLIICDDQQLYERRVAALQTACLLPKGWRISYKRSDESKRLAAYDEALGSLDTDILLLIQKNVHVSSPSFYMDLHDALKYADVVSFAGAFQWSRLDWRSQSFELKVADFFTQSSELPEWYEVKWAGKQRGANVSEMAVLDGSLLAVRPETTKVIPLDDKLEGADTLLEEDWTHALSLAGRRLAVRRTLGVVLDQQVTLDRDNRIGARLAAVEKYDFEIFSTERDDEVLVTAPVATLEDALLVSHRMN